MLSAEQRITNAPTVVPEYVTKGLEQIAQYLARHARYAATCDRAGIRPY